MAVTINVNNLSLVHKASSGIAKATLPDVCKTPSPGGPVPVPYPNIALSANLAKGTKTVKVDGGNMAAVKGSEFSISTGDEPGTLGGVKSGTFMKEATWLTYSFDVKMEGKNACRKSDKMLMNHGNTVCLAGILNPVLVVQHPDVAGELQALCNMMCDVKDIPGHKQTLIAARLKALDASMGYKSTMKAEVPYNMKDLTPYMSKREPLRATSNTFIPGHRRPDVIITNGNPPTQNNIRAVVEMKFKNDSFSRGQERAYEKIAGDRKKFITMEEGKDCICEGDGKQRQPATEPVPVYVPERNWWKVAEWSAVAVAAVATVGAVALALFPLDGPVGEVVVGSAAASAWARAFALGGAL